MFLLSRCIILLLVVLFCSNASLRADSYVVDYAKSNYQLPVWLQTKMYVISSGGLATLTYTFAENTPDRDLLVTVLFQEQEGGFLRVLWESPTEAATLVDNLQEDINMPTKRQFLIKGSLVKNGGKLIIQSGSQESPVTKIKFDELQPRTIAVSANGKDIAVVSEESELFADAEVSGDPLPSEDDSWKGEIISAALTERAERIESGLLFEFQLAGIPAMARLECRVSGLPLDKTLELWLNGKNAGFLYVQIPEITDAGYQQDVSNKIAYQGWRKAVILVSPEFLQPGANQLQLVVGGEESGSKIPLAVKGVKWQLKYPQIVVGTKAPTNTTAETTTNPSTVE